MAKTPDQELAAIIAEALQLNGLIPPDKKGEIEQRLSAGSISQDDWRHLVESVLVRDLEEHGHAQTD